MLIKYWIKSFNAEKAFRGLMETCSMYLNPQQAIAHSNLFNVNLRFVLCCYLSGMGDQNHSGLTQKINPLCGIY